jgi:hypothetical protein
LEKFKKYLHFTDNDNSAKSILIYVLVKTRFILSNMNEIFSELLTPAKLQATDEMIIPFKGRSRAKQYTKSNPKGGIKA